MNELEVASAPSDAINASPPPGARTSREEQSRASATIEATIDQSQDWFWRSQFTDGFWWAELESNATMDAEYVLMTHFLGAGDPAIWGGVAQDIRGYQRDDGSWALYRGAPGDLSTTIECYFALKLTGDAGPHLERARQFILAHGGLGRARVFTRIWLALCGEWQWDDLPAMPIELILLPERGPISIYRFSSWARATIVPLLLLMNDRPVRPVPASASLADLRGGAVPVQPRDALDRVFLGLDRVLHQYHRLPWHPLRAQARKTAEQWVIEHQEADGSWGGIQPPWVYSLMALHAIGYGLDHPVVKKGLDGMHDRWMIRRGDGSIRVQACLSPVWDSALALVALLESGVPAKTPAVQKAARWLVKEEVRVPGDWCVWVPGVEPSGWSFEFENDLYPDVDDTALVVIALHKAGVLDDATRARAVGWVVVHHPQLAGGALRQRDRFEPDRHRRDRHEAAIVDAKDLDPVVGRVGRVEPAPIRRDRERADLTTLEGRERLFGRRLRLGQAGPLDAAIGRVRAVGRRGRGLLRRRLLLATRQYAHCQEYDRNAPSTKESCLLMYFASSATQSRTTVHCRSVPRDSVAPGYVITNRRPGAAAAGACHRSATATPTRPGRSQTATATVAIRRPGVRRGVARSRSTSPRWCA
jgi:hypothetical protein